MAVPNDAAQNMRLKHVLLFLPWLALLGWFSRVAWFLCDDAFISFRYVRNLLAGHGLVFNPGEYVEGYSNFLWVLELAAVWGALGVPPEQAAPWLSAACTAATVGALLWWVARLPHLQHREFANEQLRKWKPYENMENGVIPDDALTAAIALGIRFYYLPDLKVIDLVGLTDATVARNPVEAPNHERNMAHDRRPPVGYLEERGVNFTIHPPATSGFQALDRAEYAAKVGPALWMPFDSPDRQWVFDRFAGRDLRVRDRDYVARLLGDSRPVIRSDWDVYLIENSLVYVKEPCASADTEAKFFLALYPVDGNDLPDYRKQYDFDNLDFDFKDRRRLFIGGEICAALRELPDYAVAAVSTGQYVHVEGGYNHLWEAGFDVVEPADDGQAAP